MDSQECQVRKLGKPCGDCPFSRKVEPGNLGGSTTDVYVGQAHGPFFLPCHSVEGYRGKQSTIGEAPQCAGAAIFRSNTGRDKLMPESLHKLPSDKGTVFADYTEFVFHHEGMGLEWRKITTPKVIE